ncbi:MAG TPA: hypothetical protein VHC43_04345 [Mycobacteriales bacterium]|nr:hypothetical protein [Mycobacteriales bacterium]
MSEDYVRPPIVALEVRSQWVAVWRFRILLAAVLIGLILVIALVAHHIVHSGDGSGAVGGVRQAKTLASSLG